MRKTPVRAEEGGPSPCELGCNVVVRVEAPQGAEAPRHREESVLRLAGKASWSRHAHRRRVAVCILLAACGSDGGGGGGGSVIAPQVDNSVARVDVTPSGAAALVSGATTTLVAAAFTKDNRPLPAVTVSWASSNDATATVSSGIVTARLAGTATITASAGGVTSAAITVTVVPGAPSQIGVRTQPSGAASGSAMTAQPTVEVRDAAGNLTPTAATVTVAIGAGGGLLSGTTSAATINGSASFTGLSITGTIGPRTLVFSAPGLASGTSASFLLAAGAATKLVIRTQPVGGTAYAPLVTPVVVEIQDASGNLTTSTAAVTAAIASGGGATGAGSTVTAVAGVATFSALVVTGTAGPRTLSFTSGALTSVTSASFSLTAAPPAIIALSVSPVAFSGAAPQSPIASTVAITNSGVFPLTNLSVQSITYGAGASNWLSATFPSGADAPATLRLAATFPSLAIGTYSATVVLAGDGAANTVSLPIVLTVVPVSSNAYGTGANKVSIVSTGAIFTPGFVTTSGTGAVTTPDPTVTFVARSPAIATVDATGRITAVAQGQTWIAALSTQTNSDSVLVIVPRAAGPILLTDITRFSYKVGDTISVRVQLDARGASIGAITATVSWPLYTGARPAFAVLTAIDVNTTGSPLGAISATDLAVNVIRLTGASVAGVTGVVHLATVRFLVRAPGVNGIYLNASELLASDFTNLLAITTFAQYPLIVP